MGGASGGDDLGVGCEAKNGFGESGPRQRVLLGLMGLLLATCGGPKAPTTPTDLPTPDPRRASVGGAPPPVPFDQKNFVEALFFGTGALSDPENPGCLVRGTAQGWPVGQRVRIRVSSSLTANERDGVVGSIGRLSAATDGGLSAKIETTDEADPLPQSGEITVAKLPNLSAAGCPPPLAGCAIPTGASGIFDAVRVIALPGVADDDSAGNLYAHEMGHALYGFCHVNPNSEAARRTIMGGGTATHQLTDEDVRALQSVYRAGLGPGSTRAQFVAAGLINP